MSRKRGSHAALIESPEAKRVARAIADEAWAAPFMVVEDPILRRLGASLVLQEMKARLGLPVPSAEPKKRGRKPKPKLAA